MSDLWTVSNDTFVNEQESIMRTGNVYQIANGYMGYRGTLDEFERDEFVGITLAGIYDRVGDAWREPVNAPNGGFTQITLDGEAISARNTEIVSHKQNLDLRNAVFKRKTKYRSHGKTLTITSERFLNVVRPSVGLVRYSFVCDQVAAVQINTGIDYDIWDLNGPHLVDVHATSIAEALIVCGVTSEASRRVAVAETVACGFGREKHTNCGLKNLRVIKVVAEAGVAYTFSKFFTVYTDQDTDASSVEELAARAAGDAKALGYERCLAEHSAEWQNRWAKCDVKIEGDDEAQLALRYSIFQLLIAAPVNGSANSIPARALSGQVYKGAIFWDTEMFMFPFFLHTFPEKAVELLRYRIKTLDGARRKANTEGAGYRGAFYAWESQETGDDACTYFNIGDPITGRNLRTNFRDKQVHISGDIAIAMWEYFKVTGDDSLLLDGGAEVILECARFYYSYAYFNINKNRLEILDVVGPDEYHERVNNDAYTSMVAKVTFEIANATVEYLKTKRPEALQALVGKIGVADELAAFVEAAELLYVPQPDATGVIEQFDGYFKLKDISIDELKARLIHPDEYLGAGQGLAVPTKVIKQADVVLMLNVFKDRYSQEVNRANWKYYEPRTEHGSSLSACAYAMVAAECGDLDFAYEYFLKTAKIDLEAKYKVYVGTTFMGGSHPAANGGAWMTAVFGFGGVSADENGIVVRPRLYEAWNSLEFCLVYQGDGFKIRITREAVDVKADACNRGLHAVRVLGKVIECAPGTTSSVTYSEVRVKGCV